MPNSPKPFSYDYYKAMLSNASQKGFVLSSFEKYQHANPKTVLLRHDVDFHLNGVMQMAKIEASLGASATYMFRVHANEYNLFSAYAYKILEEVLALGHEIGLHYESTAFSRALQINDASQVFIKEKKVLETIIDKPILSATEHRDIGCSVHDTPYFSDSYDVYKYGIDFFAMDPKYCKEMKYLSDSNGDWREGYLFQHIEQHKKFQILTHPDWWFEDDLSLKGAYFHGFER